ncbi:hypothetical protein, partial [Salmonella sp. s51228]|uniref:hypothetical protein n=1 Tax=Salmonella sp. s51228 TaxID=3159652 RepID=UPI00397FD08D
AEGLTEFHYLLLYGIRVLLEGNALEFNYYYQSLNVLSVIIYFIFLFLVIVVYLNIFIAQLSDTYAAQKENALKIVAQYRLEFIVQVETTSIFSLFFDFRKRFFDSEVILEDEKWLDYFSVDSIIQLAENYRSQESSETVLSKLNKLQHQSKVSTRTSEII